MVLALLLICSLGILASCNRMIIPRQTQLSKDADAKAAEGSYADAINLYEAAFDGSASSAEVHYKLALIYDDKMNDPLNALHHFKRFLTLEPSGKRAQEVKGFMKRDELTLLTNLTGDSMVPRSELVRLTNENLSLRKQIDERWAEQKATARVKGRPNEKIARTGMNAVIPCSRATLSPPSRASFIRARFAGRESSMPIPTFYPSQAI